MKAHSVSKFLAMVLAVVMLIGVIPMNAIALSIDYAEGEDDYYKLISKNDWELAPGIVESEIVLNNEEGSHRQVAHVVEVDLSNPYTKVIPSYKGMIPTAGSYGVQIMSEQAKWAEANGYGNVVAAMNIALSWYDSTYYDEHPELVGEPLGYMILDGVQYTNSQGQSTGAKTCVVINFDEKGGVARPDDVPKVEIRSTSTAVTGWEEQVIPANFGSLVKDGVNQYSEDNNASNGASRSFVGIKEDGTFVMVMNDGRQSPYSIGFTSYEMAEFMLSLGCVQAINGDGGGSSAFLSQRPGEELELNCSPSDGAERETTHGILVISTAPATGEFVRASISSKYDYYTPGSTVEFSAIGSDLVGTAAEIPDSSTWQLADDSFGTIENGVFTSNGKEGAVTVQMVYEGEVVGEDTINIVYPDTIAFGQASMVVPYGKTVEIAISATYDSKSVCFSASDIALTIPEADAAIGTFNGHSFTAAEEGTAVTSTTVTAAIGTVSATATLSLGKGSEIVYDFEDGDISDWEVNDRYGNYGPVGPNGSVTDENGNYWYNGQNEIGSIKLVTAETGKVKHGNYAMAVECDFTQIYETGYHGLIFSFPSVDITDAISVGFWMYIPYDARHSDIRMGVGGSYNTVYDSGELFLLEEGWHYIKFDVSEIGTKTFHGFDVNIDDRACASSGSYYNYITEGNLNGKHTFYVDDFTIDYSTAVDDRENPIFSTPVVLSQTGESSADLAGQTVDYNNLTFEAVVVEDTTASNATGLNAESAKAYIDGKEVECSFTGGKISVAGLTLSDGIHTVKFYIEDNMGNSSWIDGDIVVAAGTDISTVKVVPHDASVTRPLIGSLYWMDVIATDIETISKVELVFDLNNASSWELEGMEVAEGFTASYAIQEDDQIATIIIEKVGKTDLTGEATLLTFPVRTWVSTITECEGYEDQTPATLVSRGIIWKQDIELYLEKGVITYVDTYAEETTGTFGMEDLIIDTEVFFTNYSRKSVEGAEAWKSACIAAGTGWHEHTVTDLADLAPTCTKAGYTGRTYCAVCDSVVDWGTIVPATGHNIGTEDGFNKCSDCGIAYYYENGVALTGWIATGESYYYGHEDGQLANGTVTIDGHTYTFTDYILSEGSWEHDGVGLTYWWAGEIVSGPTFDTHWKTINGKKYYFNNIYVNTGVAKTQTNDSGAWTYYLFDENGVWLEDYTGVSEDYFFENGILVKRYQLVECDGYYYFINDGDKIAKNTKLYLSEKYVEGMTFPDGSAIPADTYSFDAEGKMVVVNGVHGDYMYINGVVIQRYQLFKYGDDFYFINDGNKVAKDTNLYLSEKFVEGKTFADGTAIPAGLYYFDEEGKMVVKNGVHGDYMYKNGLVVQRYQLYEYEGNYYFINDGNKIAKDTNLYLSEEFVEGKTFADGTAIPAGLYYFDEEGKLVIE